MAANMASNKLPTESSSLFQIASSIKDRLEDVPGIPPFLEMCITGNIPASLSTTSAHTSVISTSSVATTFTIIPSLQNSYSQNTPNINDTNRDSTDSHSSTVIERSTSTLALSSSAVIPLGKRIDPVTHLWQFFRLGSSLCALFNALQPHNPLNVVVTSDVKTCKRSVYDFVQGCKSELEYADDELFTISNVYSDNTTDLLKVSNNPLD